MPVGEGDAMPVDEEKAKPASEGEKAGGEEEEGIGSRIGRGREEGSGILVSYHRMPFPSIDGKKLLIP